MARSSYVQSAFIGGEFSPLAQGRSDIPQYKQAMALSLNGHPIEEGAWVKRSSFEMVVPTRGRTYGTMLPFDGSATCAFGQLFTKNNLQFITASASLIFDNTIGTITASTVVGIAYEITIDTPQTDWANGDQLMIVFPDVSSPLYPYPVTQEAGLRNRLLTILPLAGVVDSTHFYLANDLGISLGLDPSAPVWTGNELVGAQVMRVKNFTTPYSTVDELKNLRAVQIEYQSIILSSDFVPYVTEVTTQPTVGPSGADPVFSFAKLGMIDGPYLDPLLDTGTVSAYTGTITLTMTSTAPFVATDVGRLMRLFSQPADWDGTHTYSVGDVVTDSTGEWWTSIISSNLGNEPGQPLTTGGVQIAPWAPNPTAGRWAWGTISIVDSTSEVHIVLDTSIPGMELQSANGTLMTTIQLGVYAPTDGFPTCGCYHQGRFIAGGALPNRFDTTVSNGVANGVATWSPTDPYGNVVDSSGMSEIFNSKFTNNIQWMVPGPNGILMGTLNGPFLVAASQQNDPITPTDIQSWMSTKDGSAFVEPAQAGMTVIYAQKFGQKLIEYLADAFSQKFSGRHLNQWSRHLASSGVAQIVYQEEPFPCVWTRMNNGLLAGWTYRRFNRFVADPPDMAAGHWHIHGRQRAFTSLCIVPQPAGLNERMFAVTNDIPITLPGSTVPDNYFVEVMQPFFDQNQSVLQGWFNDEAPGAGPGADPAYDCGGGNASAFGQSGGLIGKDNTTPNMAGIFPYDTNPPVGTDLSANLVLREASFFDGATCLYTLPPYPSRGSQADQTSVSMSVWIVRNDAPLGTGSLFSSPALSYAEASAGSTMVSNLLGGPVAAGNPPGTMLARSTTGLDAYPNSPAEVDDGQAIQSAVGPWVHLMISWKSNGDGTFNIMAYANETLLSNATNVGSVRNNGDAWPFASQRGGNKEPGLCVWAIGGTEAANSTYNFVDVLGSIVSDPGVQVVPTLADLINEMLSPKVRATVGASGRLTFTSSTPGVPSLIQYAKSLVNRVRSALGVTKVTGNGGLSNIPLETSLGSITGYRGSVAELWIKPGFIDWSNSTNRAHFHFFDTVSDNWRPLSLGSNGGGTSLGSPYIYLSGPPSLFNLNRANGTRLAVMGNGIIASPIAPPQPA